MKKEYIYSNFYKVFCLVFLFPVIFSGCLVGGVDCSVLSIPSVRVVAIAPEGTTSVKPAEIETLTLYVFDQDGKFITTMPVALDKTTELDFPNVESFQIVALANGNIENETITDFINGNIISDGSISLKQLQAYLTMTVYTSPSDLFWGEANIVNDRQSGKTTILEIKRIVSSITVKIRGLKEFAQVTDDNFKIVVETEYNKVDFKGVPSGTGTYYLPLGGKFILVNNVSQYEIPSFNILSSEKGTNIKVKIYSDDTLIDTISTDHLGNPLTAYNGIQCEVRINYSGSIIVDVINAKWGEVLIWKDFN